MDKFKRKILKKIPTLFFIVLCFSIVFIYISLKDFLIFSSSIHTYFISGNSIFIPFLPYINILWFLPVKYQGFQFSLGHLVDIIILHQICCYIDSSIWHYIVKRYLIKESQSPIDFSEILGAERKLFVQNQNPFIKIELEKDLEYSNGGGVTKIDYNFNEKNEKIDRLYNHLNKKGFGIKNVKKLKLYKKFNFIFNKNYNYFLIFYHYSFFKKFRIFHLKYPHHYPEFNKTDFKLKFPWKCWIKTMIKLPFYPKNIVYSILFKNNILKQNQNNAIIIES